MEGNKSAWLKMLDPKSQTFFRNWFTLDITRQVPYGLVCLVFSKRREIFYRYFSFLRESHTGMANNEYAYYSSPGGGSGKKKKSGCSTTMPRTEESAGINQNRVFIRYRYCAYIIYITMVESGCMCKSSCIISKIL